VKKYLNRDPLPPLDVSQNISHVYILLYLTFIKFDFLVRGFYVDLMSLLHPNQEILTRGKSGGRY
jgi:hypothetical protein